MKIAVASGKGGTGKTLISTCLFHVLQSSGYHTTLIDCDAEGPNDMLFIKGRQIGSVEVIKTVPEFDIDKCTFCGKCREYCNYNAILMIPPAGIIRVYDELCHDCGACIVACNQDAITIRNVDEGIVTTYRVEALTGSYEGYPPNMVIESKTCSGTYSPVSVIKTALNTVPSDGIAILDSPPGTSCPFVHTVLFADHVILVAEPTPFGLSDLIQSVATLRELGKHFSVIINKAGIGNDEIYNYLKKENIKLLLEIPYSKSIASSYSNGRIATDYHPELYANFIEMFNYLVNTYGNSHNQR